MTNAENPVFFSERRESNTQEGRQGQTGKANLKQETHRSYKGIKDHNNFQTDLEPIKTKNQNDADGDQPKGSVSDMTYIKTVIDSG